MRPYDAYASRTSVLFHWNVCCCACGNKLIFRFFFGAASSTSFTSSASSLSLSFSLPFLLAAFAVFATLVAFVFAAAPLLASPRLALGGRPRLFGTGGWGGSSSSSSDVAFFFPRFFFAGGPSSTSIESAFRLPFLSVAASLLFPTIWISLSLASAVIAFFRSLAFSFCLLGQPQRSIFRRACAAASGGCTPPFPFLDLVSL